LAEFFRDNLLIVTELLSCILALLAARRATQGDPALLMRLEAALVRVASRPGLVFLTVFLLPVAIRLALLPVWPLRSPAVHDEFSHLLLADTFAHGRLTNPTPPQWIHFETFHELQMPTYCSIRPPGPALPLALAQVLTGQPWLGVLFGVGLMCGAISWMLQQYVSRTWALVGGIIAGLHYGVASSWMNSYWGGTVAAIAGALIVAELARLRRKRRPIDMAMLGAGIGLLINTRPFEGSVFSTAAVAVLLIRIFRDQRGARDVVRQLWPLASVLAAVAVWMLHYNSRTTGDPWRSAYVAGRESYNMAPALWWESPRYDLRYNHPIMEALYAGWEMDNYWKWASWRGASKQTVNKLFTFWAFFLRPALTIPLLVFLWRERWKWKSGSVAIVAAAGLAMMMELWFNPHYIAHLTGLIVLAMVSGLRDLRGMGAGGLYLSRLLPCLAAVTVGLSILPVFFGRSLSGQYAVSWYLTEAGFTARAEVARLLRSQPGKQLVFVRYGPDHFYHREWVWNDADMEHAQTVWARDLGPASDRRLEDAFPGRTVWLLEPDGPQPLLHRMSGR
jgi:hypothetical protein